MKDTIKKITIIIIGIIINVLGRMLATGLQLPIWLDMPGIMIASSLVGVWGGIAVSLVNVITACFLDVTALAYSALGVLVAIVVHIFIKKGYMNNAVKTVISGFWIGVLCAIVATPLNLIFDGGYVGNMWGNTLVDMLKWHDVSGFLATLAGSAVVEIVDKQVCVILAYLVIYAARQLKNKKGKGKQAAALLCVTAVTAALVAEPLSLQAAEAGSFDDNFIEEIYNNANGMVSSEANVICETDDGYIWIGSYAGLTRYDGKEFEFIREGGLVNVVGMMTDSRGRLWIGTNDAGIARYENGNYTYFTEEDGLPANSIRCFAEDEDGNIFVGTSDRICRFSPDDTIEILKQDITFVKAMVVYEDVLVAMDNNGGIYALYEGERLAIRGNLPKEHFYYCLAVTSKGLMAGTETGELYAFEVSEKGLKLKAQIEIPSDEISAVFEDSRGRIWVATADGFGYIDQNEIFQKVECDGFDTSIVCFHEDYQGNIWLASSHYGVMKLSQSSFINLFEKAGVEKEYVNAVSNYGGDYYCGTDEGLIVLDGKQLSQKSNELTEMLAGVRVRSIYVDTQDRLWLCTYSGLVCYDAQGGIRCYNMDSDNTTSDRFRCITELADGTFVIGTADGINFIKNDELSATLTAEDGLANTQILSVVENDGMILAGSDGSGIYVISEGKLIETYTVNDGLSSNIILRLIPHADGCLVVTSNALCHIDSDGTIRKLANFPYFNNYDVIINGAMAYVTCGGGIYEVKLSELCADVNAQYRHYGAGEGLVSGLTANSWNYISEDGGLYLCSNNGVIVFNCNGGNAEANMKYGIVSVECDGTEIEMSAVNHFTVPKDTKEMSFYASVRNYAYTDAQVRFYIKELDESPKTYSWDGIEPIRIFKPEFSEYHICLQILNGAGENVLHEKIYTVSKEAQMWEKPIFQIYLLVVCVEIFLIAISSIIRMILFIVRKNELERLSQELEQKVSEQTGELTKRQKTISDLFTQTVTALSEAVDAKDRYTSGHSKRVAEYARRIAERLGKSKEEQEEIYRAGLLHDVGKIRVPAEIINKAGKLTDEEFNTIKIHPVTGYHILRGISGGNTITIGAKYHHERYDGKGYPNGLAGERIPEVARILGVADAYDAMTSNRSYRKALPQEVVRGEIEKGKGTQFDPAFADIMLQMIDEDKDYTMKQAEFQERRILTVDDEPMNNKIIAHIMSDEPMYKVISASGGREALELLEKQPFDLILLDLHMPEMNGMETLKLIREKYKTPVVLMTGDRTIDVTVEASEIGCDDYITKPALPIMIKEVVHNMVERTNIES